MPSFYIVTPIIIYSGMPEDEIYTSFLQTEFSPTRRIWRDLRMRAAGRTFVRYRWVVQMNNTSIAKIKQ